MHMNEGLDHCGVDLVLIRTVPEGNDLNVDDATDPVYCEILPTLGEQLFQTRDTSVVIPSRIGDPSLDGESVRFHIDRFFQIRAVISEWHRRR